MLTPEIVDPEGLTRYKDFVHTLYGVVKEANGGPFPASLENANGLEHTVAD